VTNNEELQYLNLLSDVLLLGDKKSNRTGVDTISLFGTNLKFSLDGGKIPLLTTKKMFTKGIIEELLFFLRGDTNTKLLEEKGVNIWRGNTTREFLDKVGLHALPEGDMGYGYGFQWRHFNGTKDYSSGEVIHHGVDQLNQILDTIKNNPDDRRIVLTAWNPYQIKDMALPPCHMFAQFSITGKNLSCQFYMRSVDLFLGLPFNIASYAILTAIIAKASNLNPHKLVFVGGDSHCYVNHIDVIKEQTQRNPYDFPTLEIIKEIRSVEDIEALQYNDFKFSNYMSHSSLKAPMAI
jgi:thymidylate synthase